MIFFNPFQRRASAPVARERRQMLLSHECAARAQSAKRDWAVS
jgi:septum formation topological specificity factor MinE